MKNKLRWVSFPQVDFPNYIGAERNVKTRDDMVNYFNLFIYKHQHLIHQIINNIFF